MNPIGPPPSYSAYAGPPVPAADSAAPSGFFKALKASWDDLSANNKPAFAARVLANLTGVGLLIDIAVSRALHSYGKLGQNAQPATPSRQGNLPSYASTIAPMPTESRHQRLTLEQQQANMTAFLGSINNLDRSTYSPPLPERLERVVNFLRTITEEGFIQEGYEGIQSKVLHFDTDTQEAFGDTIRLLKLHALLNPGAAEQIRPLIQQAYDCFDTNHSYMTNDTLTSQDERSILRNGQSLGSRFADEVSELGGSMMRSAQSVQQNITSAIRGLQPAAAAPRPVTYERINYDPNSTADDGYDNPQRQLEDLLRPMARTIHDHELSHGHEGYVVRDYSAVVNFPPNHSLTSLQLLHDVITNLMAQMRTNPDVPEQSDSMKCAKATLQVIDDLLNNRIDLLDNRIDLPGTARPLIADPPRENR